MTTAKLPKRFSFTQAPTGRFVIGKGEADSQFIHSDNYDRYLPYIRLAESLDIRQLVSVYIRYYPLFQQAYEELGFPDRYFNDRLIEVIEHLMNTPEVQGLIQVQQPKVFYTFDDPELEALSSGQKILIRIGYDNGLKIKAKLQELRQILTSLSQGYDE